MTLVEVFYSVMTLSQSTQHQDCETDADKNDSAVISFLLTPVLFLLWHVKMSCLEKVTFSF